MANLKFEISRSRRNVKCLAPFANGRQRAAHPKTQRQIQRQNLKQDKKPQDELSEWYHRRRGEVNRGKFGRRRPGYPPPFRAAIICILNHLNVTEDLLIQYPCWNGASAFGCNGAIRSSYVGSLDSKKVRSLHDLQIRSVLHCAESGCAGVLHLGC